NLNIMKVKSGFYLLYTAVCLISVANVKLCAQGFKYFERNMAENKNVVGFNLNQNFATNSVTSGFVLDFLNGKYITNEQKDNSIANFEDHEILAGEQFNLSFSYKRKLGGSDNFLFFELGEAFFYETKF